MLFTATEILGLAFSEFLKASAGESAKKLTSEALAKTNELRQIILRQFRRKRRRSIEKLIMEIEGMGSTEAFQELAAHLNNEMDTESSFAKSLQRITQEIRDIECERPMIGSQTNNNNGQNQFIINNHGRVEIGGGY